MCIIKQVSAILKYFLCWGKKGETQTKRNTTLKNIWSVLLFYFIDFIWFWQEYSRLNIILFWENNMWKIWTVINKNYSNMFALITDIFHSVHISTCFFVQFRCNMVSVVMDRMSRMPSKCVVFCFERIVHGVFLHFHSWSFIQCHRNDYNHTQFVIRASNISCKY